MKSIQLLFLLLLTFSSLVSFAEKTDTIITVTTTQELIAAIGSNRTIVLNAQQFILPEAQSLVIKNVENLALEGAGKEAVKIHQPNKAGAVLAISFAKNVTLENLAIAHAPTRGDNTSDVLTLYTCEQITLENCSLFATGQVGINAINLNGLSCNNCIIYDCSQHLLKMDGAENLNFNNCQFVDAVTVYAALSLSKTYHVIFKSCTFSNLRIPEGEKHYNHIIEGNDIQDIIFEKCRFENNKASGLNGGPAADFFVFKKCKQKNNSFEQ